MFATMSPRRLMFLAAAMLLSLVTALTVRGWVEHVRSEAKPVQVVEAPPPPPMILVAAKNLPAGHFIKAEDLTWQSWPDANIAKSYLVQGANGASIDAIVGAVARTGIAAGAPITDMQIVKKGDHGFLAAVVQPGYRAITVQDQSNTGLSGLVNPGDRVDLILTMDTPGTGPTGQGRKVSETVLQDIRVLAVDQKLDDQSSDAPQARTVTLEVTPKEAEIVTLLPEMGKLSMTMRSIGSAENDAEPHEPTLTWDSDAVAFTGHHKSEGAALNSIEVMRGSAKSTVDFNAEGVAVETPTSSPAGAAPAAASVGRADAKALQKAGGGK